MEARLPTDGRLEIRLNAQTPANFTGRQGRRSTDPLLSRDFTETVIDAIPCMVLVKRASDLTYVRINSAGRTLLGIGDRDVLGKSDLDFFPLEDSTRIRRDDLRVLRAGITGRAFEEELETPLGRRWFSTQRILQPDFQGNPEYILAFCEDITVRKTLTAVSEMWEQVFQTAERGIAVGAPNGTTLEFMNPAFATMYGSTVEALAGTPINDLFAPSARDAIPAMLRQVELNGQHTFESLHVRQDGTEFPVMVNITAIRDAHGNVQHRAINVHDISILKSSERLMRAGRVQAEEANEAKSVFLSRISHELRTPLNVILGFAQVIQLDELPPAQEESVGHILDAGRHLLALVDDMLDISRVESGKLRLSLEAVSVLEVATEVFGMMQPLADKYGVELDSVLAGCRGHVLADRQRFKQVMLNLVSNGIKYNVHGGHVSIRCREVAAGIAVDVADTGIGIPVVNTERLFVPFDRLGKERTEIEGTGLGLSLSRSLVEAMGGTLRAARNVHHGSIFSVQLLAAEIPSEVSGPANIAASASPMTRGTVLYIEDNLANFKLVERVLSRRPGINVLPAMQGVLGLQLAFDHHPDLIVLDLHLPDMNGEEVLARLHRNPETRNIPVVIASADAMPRQVERVLGLGAAAYLTKPIDVRKFLEIVDEVLPVGDA